MAVGVLIMFDDPTLGTELPADVVSSRDHAHQLLQSLTLSIGVLSDRTAAMMLLLVAQRIGLLRESYGRTLGAKIGGVKRLNALSTIVAATVTTVASYMYYPNDHGLNYLGLHHASASIIAYVTFGIVLSFYSDSAVKTRVSAHVHLTLGLFTAFFGCGLLESLWERDEVVELSTVIATVFILFGQYHWHVSRSYGVVAGEGSARGSLIGYRPDGLPLYSFSQPRLATAKSMLRPVLILLRSVTDNSNTRTIFLYLCINSAFMVVEFVYGRWTNSLGLTSDAFHMLFDSCTLLIGLFAPIMARWKSNRSYTYGYGRVEIICGFTNGLLLAVVAMNIFCEAVHRLHAPPELQATSQLFTVSIVGLVVNVLGVVAFKHARTRTHERPVGTNIRPSATPKRWPSRSYQTFGTPAYASPAPNKLIGRTPKGILSAPRLSNRSSISSSGSPPLSPSNPTVEGSFRSDRAGAPTSYYRNFTGTEDSDTHANMRGIYLHILVDTIGSVGVIVSSFLVDRYDYTIADPICSIFSSVLILTSVLPLLRRTAATLLNRVPTSLPPEQFRKALTHVSSLEGVMHCNEVHFWRHAQHTIVGTMHVIVASGTNDQRVLSQVTAILKELGVDDITVQIEVDGLRSRETQNDTYLAVNPQLI